VLFQAGCAGQRELKDLNITVGVGIDSDEQTPGYVKITAQVVNPSEVKSGTGDSGSSAGKGSPYINIDSSGSNTFAAVRDFTHELDERLYQAHTQVIILGEDIARGGIIKHLDFFVRAVETRPTVNIVVADGTAYDVLNIRPEKEKLPAMHVDKLIGSQELNSQSKPATILDYLHAMTSKTYCLTVPVVSIVSHDQGQILVISEMGVFKEDRMVGKLNLEEARGLLWIDGKIKSGVVNVKLHDGEAAIDIKNAKSEVSVSFNNSLPVVNIDVEMTGTLATQTCGIDLNTMEGMDELRRLANQHIIYEVTRAIDKAKEYNTDIFGFGEKFHKRYKKAWRQMEDNWDVLFRQLVVNLKVVTKITSTGTIQKPTVPDPEK